MSEWISVNDRLPDDSNFETVVYDGECAYTAYYNSEDGFFYIDDDGLARLSGVTYWMPLPKPPEAE